MGKLNATAITKQVKKLPKGWRNKRLRLSIQLNLWLIIQALSWASTAVFSTGGPSIFARSAAPIRLPG